MKVVFVAFGFENLGVEYLSSCLKQKGHQTFLVFDPCLFKTYHFESKLLARFFDRQLAIVGRILKVNPDMVVFSVLSDNYSWAKAIAEGVKKHRNDLPVVFGGIHATCAPELLIEQDFIDYVCVGEGEEALTELVDVLGSGKDASSVANIWSKKSGVVFCNKPRNLLQDLDLLPLPDKDLFYREYSGFTGNIYMTMTSRGCPFRCTYCYNSYLMELYREKGQYLRRLSVGRVIEELCRAKSNYRMRRIAFVDDVFTSDADWLADFVREYKKKINLPFGCLVHPSFVNEKIVGLLNEAGCTSVGMGIQTLNEPLKRAILSRYEDNAEIEKAIALFKNKKIFIYVDFIFGLPDETDDDAKNAALFLSRTRPDGVSTLWLRYYPRTEIIKISKAKQILSDLDEREINESLVNRPVSVFGNSKTTIDKSLVSFLLVSSNLPPPWVKFFIKRKFYYLFPKANLHHLHTLIKQARNSLVRGKEAALYYSFFDLVKYYLTYMSRYFRSWFICM